MSTPYLGGSKTPGSGLALADYPQLLDPSIAFNEMGRDVIHIGYRGSLAMPAPKLLDQVRERIHVEHSAFARRTLTCTGFAASIFFNGNATRARRAGTPMS